MGDMTPWEVTMNRFLMWFAIATATLSNASLAGDGISRLLSTSRDKAVEANREATDAAQKQRQILKNQQRQRDLQKDLDRMLRQNNMAGQNNKTGASVTRDCTNCTGPEN